ncbi:hypothetical protein DRE_07316 [Drechslerella stenobrocha 248]|uniref:CSN8/PSMD8/EIF3K domain-containing protein n=1 Tax=Drechslerella stenobrocha 248 TaxID=1043628 RepID=W7HUT5_9PEZI|nr:hypothetical protein DRE_07316 [Drechslerella stenobrocha 248]
MFKRQAQTPASSASISQAGMTRSTRDWSKGTSKPLEYGLASKGDTRLTDPQTQEAFFHTIQTRYLMHIGSSASVPALDEQFAALSIASNNAYTGGTSNISGSSGTTTATAHHEKDLAILQNILMDMRKLREGLLASNRLDDFAKSAYIFIARAAILMSHPESYFPSLRHLLYVLHPVNPLSNPEVTELAGYLMLHLACATRSFHDAYEVKVRFRLRDHRVETAVRALVAGDYWLFWSTKRLVDGYKSKIMDRAVRDVRKHALKCVGSAYHVVETRFLEACAERAWPVVREEFAIAWEESGGRVVIRRRPDAKGAGRGLVVGIRREEGKVGEDAKADTGGGLMASRWSTAGEENRGSGR